MNNSYLNSNRKYRTENLYATKFVDKIDIKKLITLNTKSLEKELEIDHQNAKTLEEGLSQIEWVKKVIPVVTNIIILEVESEEIKNSIINSLKDKGILCSSFGLTAIRFVTHLDISSDDIEKTISVLKGLKN